MKFCDNDIFFNFILFNVLNMRMRELIYGLNYILVNLCIDGNDKD